VSLSSIPVEGLGKAVPVVSNDTAEGRQRNRRVEIVINGDSIGNSAAPGMLPSN
jgi:outer membrane protein OmpA-like peptidoglycan-associated protein